MNCTKKGHSLLKDLSYDELALLDEKRYLLCFKTGEKIYRAGARPAGLLCLNEGKVKITRRGVNGNEQIIALHRPVEFIGFRSLMSEENYSTSAIALEDTTVCVVDKNDFFKVIGSNSTLAFKLIRLFARQLTEADQRLMNLTQKHMRARLAEALLLLAEVYGTSPENSILNVSLKRSDLAALANMTTANAIRILSAFAKEKVVEINQREIKIKNLKVLNNISQNG